MWSISLRKAQFRASFNGDQMELIKSISIENVVAKRDAAVARLTNLFDTVDEVDREISALSGSRLQYLLGGGRDCRLFERDGLAAAIRTIDSGIWAKLLLESGLRSFMASGDRERWDGNIMNCDVPELTLDNVTTTFKSLYAQRGEMFIDGVVAVFRSLSWDHKTNSPMAFGKKIILANLWSDKGSYLNYRRCDVLDDLLRAMCVLDGKPEPDARNGMSGRIHLADRPGEVWDDALKRRVQPEGTDTLEDDYFTLKWFKKSGTAHIVFKRQDLVDKMNMVLGSRFPDAIATDIRNPVHRPKPAPVPGKRSISAPALTALRAARVVENRLEGLPPLDRLVYEEVARILSSLGGAWNAGLKAHVFDGLSRGWLDCSLKRCLREGAYDEPDDFGFFPTPAAVVEDLIVMAELRPGMRVLEPSAGRGAIVKALLDEGCTVKAIELMEANISHLHQFNCSVSQADFLEYRVEPEYDAVVMNPPFAKHQDIAHVMHAVHFLKPGGRLVAVMSAGVKFNSDKYSAQFRQYVSEYGEMFGLPPGSFKESGTMVNTVVVVINKPDPALQLKAETSASSERSQAQLTLA